MASIKAIEAKSVHQIQSGQVIVDLCSVVKELVENSLDAGATTLEVRFKNYGLDLIEVQDNGSGIDPSNYANVALKHYTSKLSSYDDLSRVQTFGFRGEALSSLCALSTFSVTTAMASEAPKGTRLDFDMMGKLKSTTTVASGRGTTASVEQLFGSLPVRRRELTKNIKREYGKVVGLLHAYACVGVNVKFSFKNAVPKGKSMVVFSTKGNATTRENIANIYGAKTLPALVALDLQLSFQPSATQLAKDHQQTTLVVKGHISKPVFGEGRQTPDRQMFFVNGRPCGLPQIAKAINEVYKSFNVSQSPFIFADFLMDTAAYDVNVSPDKRTILLHDAAALIESLKESLTDLFDNHEQTVPQSQFQTPKLPVFKQLSVQRPQSVTPESDVSSEGSSSRKRRRLTDDDSSVGTTSDDQEEVAAPKMAFVDHFREQASTREERDPEKNAKRQARMEIDQQRRAQKAKDALQEANKQQSGMDEYDDLREMRASEINRSPEAPPEHGTNESPKDIDGRESRQPESNGTHEDHETINYEPPIPSQSPIKRTNTPGVVQNAFDRMKPLRLPTQLATIEVDGVTSTGMIGTQTPIVQNAVRSSLGRQTTRPVTNDFGRKQKTTLTQFSQRLRRFGAEVHEPDTGSDGEAEGDAETGGESHTAGSVDASADEAAEDVVADDEEAPEHVGEAEPDEPPDPEPGSQHPEEEGDKAEEDARVAELIRAAEETTKKVNNQRAVKALKGMLSRDTTTSLAVTVDVSIADLREESRVLCSSDRVWAGWTEEVGQASDRAADADEEAKLALTVSKADFAEMKIVGQFNLGFILAVRPAAAGAEGHRRDELFIIDQHASDEKFNFERLQAETTVGNQRMVRPVNLDLTAVEEEIVLENTHALEKNGFLVEVDTSGGQQIGRRCTLHTLPLSKEVVFDTRDLEELIHLLSESPMLGMDSAVPRPTRVRKMFAMRACRSSIMIGKTLSKKQMKTVVMNMGTIDKPWNCPHGRPTMRHLTSLDAFGSWSEGDYGGEDDMDRVGGDDKKRWTEYLNEE
ncbi:DNA mismatch repair protein PMS1 [Cyphellophora attinorum]|uniref:DNA mismatch repair protein PMS1 n=1 Tax=Cyphellophora attinorum TaxID=1664694 RepID=A0A0N1NYX1_9EURO|nr:DNA mismatch repair protein PMS1 [Phialophora attinorum]KPI40952.1 DNA mismatch repair protein PMS1 [Phialophora attinorum]